MLESEWLGLGVVLLAIIAGRFIMEAALAKLPTEKKAALIDGFSTQRKWGLVALLLVIVALYNQPPVLLGAALAVYVVGTQAWAYRTLRALEMPKPYVRSFAIASFLSIGSLAVYFALIFATSGSVA